MLLFGEFQPQMLLLLPFMTLLIRSSGRQSVTGVGVARWAYEPNHAVNIEKVIKGNERRSAMFGRSENVASTTPTTPAPSKPFVQPTCQVQYVPHAVAK